MFDANVHAVRIDADSKCQTYDAYDMLMCWIQVAFELLLKWERCTGKAPQQGETGKSSKSQKALVHLRNLVQKSFKPIHMYEVMLLRCSDQRAALCTQQSSVQHPQPPLFFAKNFVVLKLII